MDHVFITRARIIEAFRYAIEGHTLCPRGRPFGRSQTRNLPSRAFAIAEKRESRDPLYTTALLSSVKSSEACIVFDDLLTN